MSDRKEALLLAIQNEIMAQNLYALMAKAFTDEQSRAMFLGLVPLEELHEDKLTEVFRSEFGDEDIDVDREALPSFKARQSLEDPLNILRFAVDQELVAHADYKRLAATAADDDTRVLFQNLAAEELNHKALLEARMEEMHGLLTWFDPSELNGLMED